MARIPCRKLNLVDGMILIGAAAGGFGLIRFLFDWELGPGSMTGWPADAALFVLPVVFALSIGLTIIRLRRPRPPIHRIFRQPGLAASAIAVGMTTFWCVPYPIALATKFAHYPDDQGMLFAPIPTGAAIVCAWALLAVTRTGRHERGWIDRLGIALGVCWIILFAMDVFAIYAD